MLLLTAMLLLILAITFGFFRRPWWQIGTIALLACVTLQSSRFWMDDWRYRVGLSHHEQWLDPQLILWVGGWLLLSAYGGYALGLMYSRWQRIR